MKCFVTGINGVVGRNLSIVLAEKYDFDIWGCGRSRTNESNYITIDLIDRAAVLDLFAKNRFDYVIHCAANINDDEHYTMFNNNITSTLNIIEASLSSGVKKIFHTSGIPVIGKILELPITEEHPTNPLTAYHLSKLHSEQIIERFCKDKIDFVNIRMPSPVGRKMPLRSILPIFIEKFKNNKIINLTGNANRKQNFLDIRDLASFIHKASLTHGISGLFNVASSKTYSNLELAETIASLTGSSSKIVDNMSENCSKLENWDISTKKAKDNFGYISEHSLVDTIEWIL